MSESKPSPQERAATPPRDDQPGSSPTSAPRRVDSRELLGGAVELLIAHGGREYRLRVTQYGKLILTA